MLLAYKTLIGVFLHRRPLYDEHTGTTMAPIYYRVADRARTTNTRLIHLENFSFRCTWVRSV